MAAPVLRASMQPLRNTTSAHEIPRTGIRCSGERDRGQVPHDRAFALIEGHPRCGPLVWAAREMQTRITTTICLRKHHLSSEHAILDESGFSLARGPPATATEICALVYCFFVGSLFAQRF